MKTLYWTVVDIRVDSFKVDANGRMRGWAVKIVFHANARAIYNFLDFIKMRGKQRGAWPRSLEGRTI